MKQEIHELSGRYSVLDEDGDYVVFRFRPPTPGRFAEDRTVISVKDGDRWEGIGFASPDAIQFWRRVRECSPDEALELWDRAYKAILNNPESAAELYALQEERCSRCGRQLTDPASIDSTMGPVCAGHGHWTKQDHREVYQRRHCDDL